MSLRKLSSVPLAAAVALLAAAACSGPADGRTQYIAPDPGTFPPVGDTLENHCGTLDCHGNIARNLRVYGVDGLRLDPGNVPGIINNPPDAGNQTTAAEYEATYRSVTMLEPEVMYEVLRDHGANPGRLTIVRKARGTEHHKGGAPMPVGSPGDRCLTSWLAGHVDTASCGWCGDLTACCLSPHMPPNSSQACQQILKIGDNGICQQLLAKDKLAGYCN